MHKIYTLTTVKAKLSSIISEVEFSKKKVFVTRKGKNVAAIIPFSEYQKDINKKVNEEGLILAKGALSDLEGFEDFIETISKARRDSVEREVKL